MKQNISTAVSVACLIISIASLWTATKARSDVDSKIAVLSESISKTIADIESKQQAKNEANVKYGESVGENLMSLIKRVTVLEAKNIVRGE